MTIDYHYESEFRLDNETEYSEWISRVIVSEGAYFGPINYIFCDDSYLLALNQKYLDHNTFTDIITFDYSNGTSVSGDIFISIERVIENAAEFKVSVETELRRVMAHGLLHLLGYGDKGEGEQEVMRAKENEKMVLFHVEQ